MRFRKNLSMARTCALAGAMASCLALTACARDLTAEQFELDNIRSWNEVPRSAPSQFVKAFGAYCLAPSLDGARQALRQSDYAQVKTRGANIEAYLVDDTKPAVMLLSGSDYGCAVVAKSRTGQSNRVEGFVAAEFPSAMAVDPSSVGRKVERVWHVPGTGTLFTQRGNTNGQVTTLMFGISRS